MKKILGVVIVMLLTQAKCVHHNSGYSASFKDSLVCTMVYSDTALKERNRASATLDERYWWPHGTDMQLILFVKFLNGTEFQKSKVMQYAAEWDSASALGWNGGHKINFMFVGDNYPPRAYTDIRILFNAGGGSHSVVGSDCKNVPDDQPTTVFGWVDPNHSEADIRSVILHELGHTLGLIHEHQNPTAGIKWNKPAAYQYYHDTQSPPWTPAMVDQNVINVYDRSITQFTNFDPSSIMCYYIPSFLTLDGYSTSWNYELSPMDKAFIKTIYPYYPCVPKETCCFDRHGKRIPCP